MNDETKMLDATEVAAMLGLNKRTLYRFLKSPAGDGFPEPITFTERTKRWRRADVERWIDASASGKEATGGGV